MRTGTRRPADREARRLAGHLDEEMEESLSHLRIDLARCEQERNEARERLVEFRVALERMYAVADELVTEHGVEHDDFCCPEDDTCRCANVARINTAFRLCNALLKK